METPKPAEHFIHGELEHLTQMTKAEKGGNPRADIDREFMLGVAFLISKLAEKADKINRGIFTLTVVALIIGVLDLLLKVIEMFMKK